MVIATFTVPFRIFMVLQGKGYTECLSAPMCYIFYLMNTFGNIASILNLFLVSTDRWLILEKLMFYSTTVDFYIISLMNKIIDIASVLNLILANDLNRLSHCSERMGVIFEIASISRITYFKMMCNGVVGILTELRHFSLDLLLCICRTNIHLYYLIVERNESFV